MHDTRCEILAWKFSVKKQSVNAGLALTVYLLFLIRVAPVVTG